MRWFANAGCDHVGGTVFMVSTEELKHVRSESGEILTEPFLHVCKGLLCLLDDFGPSLAFVKTDVGGNIEKLESKYSSNPKEFGCLSCMVNLEVKSKTVKNPSSCTVALLWLTR
ncbi:hypothetical protein MLD38_018118 [Melastoma candidum]|uniref:Uncharacterized protein n=1 Tax=Melastoma candidum TaxID=119954 RepID=A0ACB9QT06_9MYRT|nr:hypothetical protein MLD38_018118 [Melastoma candidum]